MADYLHAEENAKAWMAEIEDMLSNLEEFNKNDAHDLADDTLDVICNTPLSVRVKDGWYTPGNTSDGPEEYEILLTMGGPALRIYGKLNQRNEAFTAELEMQDWGLPWKAYDEAHEETLLKFANKFWFGN